ncbi:MAG: DUF3618 domain-containing protein [Candidatus Abyssobacteria bacterium SURF_5]|uniref:DUF3618 domain-containing protein n=1 Tax=Abyssobacteria bacterium (strain SURF_5) TaxID=2093360 RepID=A0A3A4NU87_ABYX5|nr:MAG: DUF3618 domain-containing protein [Candidatus Abyssubacteria bacterium SURF_5]
MGEKTGEIRIHEHSATTSVQTEGLSDTERLRAEIEQTRLEMSRTLDEIRGQLAPSRLREQAKMRVKQASVRRAKRMNRRMRNTVREHPLTAAIFGFSTFWLLKEGIKSARGGDGEFEEEYVPGRYGYGGRLPYEEEGIAGEPGMEGEIPEARGEVGERFEEARERAAEKAEEVRLKAGRYRERAGEKASEYAGKTREKVGLQRERIQGTFNRMLNERPLVVVAAALGLGAFLGSLIPESRKEHELMGEQKEAITGRLKEKAQESFEKAKTVAKDTAEFAKRESKEKL